MPSNKASCSLPADKDTTTGDQDNDCKEPTAAIATTRQDAPYKDLLKMLADQQKTMADQQKLLVDLFKKMSTTNATTEESLFDRMSRRIDKFAYDPEQDDCFSLWYSRHKDIFEIDCKGMEEKMKTRLLVSALDAVSHTRFSRYILPKEPSELSWMDTLGVLKTLFGTKKSLFRRRFECFRMNFSPNEDIDNFVNLLKVRAMEANFKDIKQETLECLALTFAFQAPELAEYRIRFLRRLDEDENTTVDDLAKEYHAWKSVKDDSKIVEAVTSPGVCAVQKRGKRRPRLPPKPRSPPSPCPICQHQHWKKDCPENRKVTSAAQESRTAPRRRQKQSSPRIWYQRAIGRAGDVQKYLEVHINGHPTHLQLDTGADVTIISRPTWMQLGSPHLQKTYDVFKGANGQPLVIHGKFEASFVVVDNRGKAHPGQGICYVSDDLDLLGITWIEQISDFSSVLKKFNIHKVQTLNQDALREPTVAKLKRTFPDVFMSGLGCCTKTKATLSLKPDARPIFIKKRPVPYASVPLLDAEIDRLLAQNVISAVDHSQWAAPIVVVRKANGTIRLCADFSTGLNDALLLHRHPLPTAEDVFTKLNGGTVFSQIDFADAYLQIEVDNDSKELLTVNTHRGLYRYNRLPFGVKSAPGIFQQIIDSMIAGLNGVAAYLDDVIVTGRTLTEHNANLEALFSRISAYGFRVRIDKCHFVMTQLTYLGNIITAAGRRPDPRKIDAISKMPKPKDTAQVRSFLGLINHYGAFVPEMRQLRAPLDALLKKDASFNWNSECDAAFERAKEILASDLLLTHYDPKLPIIVAADASEYGIGAVISHRNHDGSEKAIYHASRSLTAAEKNYGQIEKEGLALIFAVRKFHRYLYGRRFTLLTDHKPLLAIFGSKKGIPAYSANRLQRWRLTLLAYDFDIEYRSTTSFGQADALSRLIAAQSPPEEDVIIAKIAKDVDAIFCDHVSRLPLSANDIARATAEDDCLRQVLDHVTHDTWPKKPSPAVARYAHLRDDLSTQQGCLLFGARIIIPPSLQPSILKTLHEGHPGMNRMKALARSYVFWTGINEDVEKLVRTCTDCQEAAKSPIKHTLCPWPRPSAPWSRIHIDYAGPLDGISYLVVVDAFSKWPEIIPMTSTTTTATLKELQSLFARFGFPQIIVSDNGTQFTSTEFQDFCRKKGIEHIRSPPFHPQSNGQAERFVDTFKRTLQKLKNNGTTTDALQTFLFTYRNTPCASSPDGRSPAENFIGRHLRSTLDLLRPNGETGSSQSTDMEKQFNRRHGARPRKFEPDDLVYARDYRSGQPRWSPGRILLRHGRALYDVMVQGSIWKRHVNQLLPRTSMETATQLMEAFDVPFNSSAPPSQPQPTLPSSPTLAATTSTTKSTETTTTTIPTPSTTHRRSTRIRHPPEFLQIDPYAKSYYGRQS